MKSSSYKKQFIFFHTKVEEGSGFLNILFIETEYFAINFDQDKRTMNQQVWEMTKWKIYKSYKLLKKLALTPLVRILNEDNQLSDKTGSKKQGFELFVVPSKSHPHLNCLMLGKIKRTNSQHVNILSRIHEAYPKIQTIFMSECQVNQQIIKSVPNVQYLLFQMCRIQNDYADILEKSCSQSIKQLSIHSDWIGNVGIKKLMKLHMPNLKILCLQNTNITTDFAKMLSKKQWKKIIGIVLCQQFFFNYDQLMKTMKYLDAKQAQKSDMFLIGSFDWGPNMFLYWGQLSKIRIKDNIENETNCRFQIVAFEGFDKQSYSMMIPSKTKQVLQQVVHESIRPGN